MKLDSPRSQSIFNFTFLRRYRAIFVICFISFFVIFSSGFFIGSKLSRAGVTMSRMFNQSRALGTALVGFVRGQFVQTDHLYIDINHQNYQKLAFNRQYALDTGILSTTDDDFVPAKITLADQTVDVDLRLKGDRLIHYQHSDKWSFRIQVDGDQSLLGMTELSLHRPGARNYIYEWIFHELLSQEGVLALRYQFVDVTINGRYLGTYALEEHFAKQVVESQEFREGPIIRFSEDSGTALYSSPIDTYQTTKWSLPQNHPQAQKAIDLLQSFRRGELTVGQVFDTQKLATFLAISDLLETHHATISKSLRFYYNPITSLLEPIGFDGHSGVEDTELIAAELGINPQGDFLYTDFGGFYRLLFNNPDTFDPEFHQTYIHELQRLSDPAYLDEFFASHRDQINKNQALIYKNFLPLTDRVYRFGPDFYRFDPQIFYSRQNYIRSKLNPPTALQVHLVSPPNQPLALEVANNQILPVWIDSITINDQTTSLPEPISLLATQRYQPLEFIPINFPTTTPDFASDPPPAITLNYRLIGQDLARFASVLTTNPFSGADPAADLLRQPPNHTSFDFFTISHTDQTITINQPEININRTLVLPSNFTLVIPAGTRINLTNNATILSRASIQSNGTSTLPVIFSSSDDSGQGLLVLDALDTSYLHHTIFSGLTNPTNLELNITGAVTFYQSPVIINSGQFHSARSEDALNIIRTHFEINSSDFTNSFSDAFDGDFVSGSITDSSFTDITNDAIDISGSQVTISQIDITNAGDKGISVGENSQLDGQRLTITNSNIGIASKDLSLVRVQNVQINNATYALTAYQKKPEFGSAILQAIRTQISNSDQPYLVETDSKISHNYVPITTYQDNVAQSLYDTD